MARFQDIKGHHVQIAQLRRIVSSGRIHHAQLFAGPSGVGKSIVARAFVAALFCDQRVTSPALDSCGECRSCRWVAEETHPDLMVVAPERQVIRQEQAKAVISATYTAPRFAPYRIVLIEEAHRLGETSANTLLKTLEEPSGRTLFVLLSDQPQALLETILSRVQRLNFGPLDYESLEALLEQRGVGDERVRIARLARGSIGEAMAWIESGRLERHDKLMIDLLSLRARQVTGALSVAKDIGVAGVAQDEAIPSLLMLAYEAARVASGLEPGFIAPPEIHERLGRVAKARGVHYWSGWAAKIEEVRSWANLYLDARLLTEHILLDYMSG